MADEKGTNWLGGAFVFGAGAAGYSVSNRGYGSYEGARNAFSSAWNSSYSAPVITRQNAAQRAIQDVASSQGDAANRSRFRKQSSLARLERIRADFGQQFKGSSSMNAAVVREWEAAKNAVLPVGNTSGFLSHVSDPFEGPKLALSNSNSVYVNDVFSRFSGNIEALMKTGYSKGLQDLSPITKLPSFLERTPAKNLKMKGFATQLSSILGNNVSVSQRGQQGMGEFTFSMNNKTLVTLPEAFGKGEGMARSGKGLHNISSPGRFAVLGSNGALGDRMTFSELKAQEILKTAEESMSSGFSSTLSAERAIANKSAQLDKLMDFMEPNLGDTSDYSLETFSKAQRLTVLDETGNVIRGKVAEDFLKGQTGLTPTAKAGRFQTMAAEELTGGFSNLQDYARKPWQWIRQDRPSAGAQAAILGGDYGKEFNFMDSPAAIKQFGGPSGARLKTLYLDSKQLEMLEGLGFPVGDGELLVNEKFKKQAEVKRLRRVTISEMTPDLETHLRALKRGSGLNALGFMEGNSEILLGREANASLVTAAKGTTIKGFQAVETSTGGIGYNLLLEEEAGMGTYEKKFGGLKGMARQTSFSALSRSAALQKVSGLSQSQLSGLGAIGRLSDIKRSKDPALAAMQQFTGIAEHARLQGNTAFLQSASSEMSRINQSGDVFGELKKLGAQAGLAEGSGAYNRIFGGEAVLGISRLHSGGPKEFTGAGKMGTLEPRILNLLEGQGGTLGNRLGSDLLNRVLLGDPDKLSVNEEMRKTFESMAPGATAPPGVDIRNLDGPAMENLRKTGGHIATGIPDMPSIYMPGYENIPTLAPYKVDGKMINTAPIQKTFKGIERTVRETLEGTLSPEKAMGMFEGRGGYMSELYQQFAPAGKGQGSLARGSVFGSRFLTAVSGDADFAQRASGLGTSPVVGIPKDQGLKMIQELSQHGMDVGDIEARFLAGKAVGGAVARHPFIGAYSMQPVNMLMTQSDSPVMYVPETTVRATAGSLGELSLTDGVLKGLAMDKDADTAMAIMVDQASEKQIQRQLFSQNTAMAAAAQHSARSQLLSAKLLGETTGNLSRAEQIAAAGTKLGVVDEYVGRVSSQLSMARAAVVASDLDAGSQRRSLGLLEWLEQQPISGKHLTEQRVLAGEFGQQMESLITGAAGDSDVLSSTVRDMVPRENRVAQAILGKGFDLDAPINLMGQSMGTVEGFDLDTSSRQIAESVQKFRATRQGSVMQADIEKWMRPGANVSMSQSQIPAALEASSTVKQAAQSGFKEQVKGHMASINKAASRIVERTRPMAKPAMAGLAAVAAAGLIFSGPPGSMDAPPPPPRMGAMQAVMGRGNRDQMSVPEVGQTQMGSPTNSRSIANRSIQLDEAQADRSRNIRMNINANGLTAQQRQSLSNRLGSRFPGTMDVNVRDSRRTLNQNYVTDMLGF